VLLRQVPKVKRFLAYLPEGPVLDWAADDLAAWLDPMVEHLRGEGAFGIKMGPPVVRRRWSAATVKAAIAEGSARQLADVPPDCTDDLAERVATALTRAGWRAPSGEEGFSAGQPQYVFQVPLAGRSEEELLAGFNQLWRRNIKKADKLGVVVRQGSAEDLPAFHTVYLETAERDHFTGRPLSYFQRMWTAMRAEDPDRIRLYLAEHDGDLVAATTMVRVGGHAWYSYGASSTAKREVRGSNAVQWAMLRDAKAAGATVYDLRGITDTLAEDDPHFGLIQFKLGTGGEAVEYLGEWDLPLNKLLFKVFDLYMARR
jgi:lipid II:glycine glycyltransferase (peptidoglycan interpeptide bridge formation enzyme)